MNKEDIDRIKNDLDSAYVKYLEQEISDVETKLKYRDDVIIKLLDTFYEEVGKERVNFIIPGMVIKFYQKNKESYMYELEGQISRVKEEINRKNKFLKYLEGCKK